MHRKLTSNRTPRSSGRRALVALLALFAALLTTGLATVAASGPASAAIDACGAGGNKITCENSKPGTDPSVWDINRAGDDSIQGFATDISVNVGQKIDLKIDTDARNYKITIFRTGYYQGLGARQIATVVPSATLPQRQPQCITDVSTELYDCGNWAVSASWNVPATAVSGVYIALLEDPATGDASHITFIVRDDSSTAPVLFQTSDPTWQAYNTYGGSDFYQGGDHGRAYKVSYNRPVLTRSGTGGRDFYMSNEYAAVRFMERNGYDVTYMAGVDSDRYGNLIKNHKVFMSVGHDEYWSKAQRANVTAARDAGVNLMFLSGNEVYWKTRYEASADASHTAYRTLVSYKETWGNAKIDPSAEWTGTWRDPRFAPTSAGGGSPENGLTGQFYMSNDTDLAMQVSAAEGKLRLWRNTSLATMSSGSATLAPHTVGYESDEDLDNGFRPAGLVRLSTTTGAAPQYLRDFGNVTSPGTTTHHLTLYRAASGALVFAAGTIQWTWGLDEVHDSPYAAEPADVRMQQAQVNLFADMGVQPATLMTGLVAANRSTDTTGPTTTISSPAANTAVANGTKATLTGTAADATGKVAGVEVSTDGGTSWHPATGTTSWSYSYIQKGTGSTSVRVRAVDDSANIGAVASRAFSVGCPCSVYGAEIPDQPATDDAGAVELGLRFTAVSDGYVSGVRFYKGSGNTGTHVGSVWSTTGTRLASATFAGETATGWQTASFTTPVAVSAGQSYVVSYTAPVGRYAAEPWAFAYTGIDAGPLTVAGGYSAAAAGTYGAPGQFPDQSYQKSSYYVDPVFALTDTSPLVATNQSPADGTASVALTTKIAAKFSKPVVSSSVSVSVKNPGGTAVAGATSYDAVTRTVTFTPSTALAPSTKFTVTLAASDTTGGTLTTGKTWSFTTAAASNPPGVCPCTLFDESLTPTQLEDSDPAAVTLGVRFTADTNGTVTGVKFYKGPNNTGSHTGALWSADGTKLAEGTFSNESSTGWQTLSFATPVAITKNLQYVASYRAPVGKYSASPGAFSAADLSRAPLYVTATAGAYTYGTGFPGNTSSANYMVDLIFQKSTPTIAITSRDPAPGATDVGRSATIKVAFSAAIKTSGYTLAVASGGSTVAGSAALNAAGTQLTFTPSAPMPASATVNLTLSGVTSTDGAALATTSWSFATRSASTAASQSLFGDVVPDTAAVADDPGPLELGVTFTPAKNGTVTALRFYKGAGNGGTHTGSLWSAGGDRIATVTFTGETVSGWQTATLATPVAVTAGTSYVASYFAPQGHYAHTGNFFSGPWTAGDLTAPAANNGRFVYGTGGGFPNQTYGSANYFVDVSFTPAVATIAVTGRTPASGATGVVRGVSPSATFSAPVAAGYSMTVRQGNATIAGTVTQSTDKKKLTFAPSAALPADADIMISLIDVTSTEGASLPDETWTFRTEAASQTLSLFSGVVPSDGAANDSDPVELGVSFTSSTAGQATAIRFYKGAANTGTHVGSIWDASGNQLAQVTFTSESATGWQTANLATPLNLTVGQKYVVSYFAPAGHYAVTGGFFADPWTSGPLTVAASTNGLYRYGAGGGFPTGTWNSTNYFVDVVFRPS